MSWLRRRLRPPHDEGLPDDAGLTAGETERLRARIEQERDRLLAGPLDDATRGTLEEIAYALVRIEDGTYGDCAGCRLPIPLPVLEAMPTARYCPSCRARRESGAGTAGNEGRAP